MVISQTIEKYRMRSEIGNSRTGEPRQYFIIHSNKARNKS